MSKRASKAWTTARTGSGTLRERMQKIVTEKRHSPEF